MQRRAGKIRGVRVTENATRNRALGACVAAVVRRWVFPRPGALHDVEVVLPFMFGPG